MTMSASGLTAAWIRSKQASCLPSSIFSPKKLNCANRSPIVTRHCLIPTPTSSPLPFRKGYKSAWAQYSVLAADEQHRTDLQNKLKEAGIPTAIYYPTPLHLQSAFSGLGYKKGDFPVSEESAERIFSLPMHPYLTEESTTGNCRSYKQVTKRID